MRNVILSSERNVNQYHEPETRHLGARQAAAIYVRSAPLVPYNTDGE